MPDLPWPVVGHEWAVDSLARDIATNRLRHAYLFTGPAGVGKRTLAFAFSQALLCPEPNAPCCACRTCNLIAQARHPDVSVITPAVSGQIIKTAKITIDPIRALIRRFALRPVEAQRRVAIITAFEAANPAAANALLKTLEEPPGDGLLILTASSDELLLPTIVSRCERLALRPLPLDLVQRTLERRWGLSSDQSELLAHLSGGRLGWAVTMASDEAALGRRAERLSEMCAQLTATRVERFAYAEALARDRESLYEALDLWQSWWRDVWLAATNAATPPLNVDRIAEIQTVAAQVHPAQVTQVVAAIRTTRDQLDQNANARLALEVLLLDLPKIRGSGER